MTLNDLQYLAAMLGIVGVGILSLCPKHIRKGLVIAAFCNMCWVIYGLHVEQYMVALTQAIYFIFSIVGLYRWYNIKI